MIIVLSDKLSKKDLKVLESLGKQILHLKIQSRFFQTNRLQAPALAVEC